MLRHLFALISSFVVFAACSGGGSSGTADVQTTGRVVVVVDTRAGDEALVQFLVAGVTLERADGSQTDNLLASPAQVTFGDPAGEPCGLPLERVAGGEYVGVHVVLTPSSGVAITDDGVMPSITAPLSLFAPLDERLAHDGVGDSWLVVAHTVEPLTIQGANATWTPDMVGRASGEPVGLDGLVAPVVRDDTLFVTAFGDRALRCGEDRDTEYVDVDGSRLDRREFLAGLIPEDVFCARGALRRDGTYDLRRIERCQRQVRPRLIGHVQSVDAAEQAFVLRVQAANGPFGSLLLQTPEDVLVRAGSARLERPNGQAIPFSAITVGRLAKVRWSSRDRTVPGLPEYVAELVQAPGAGHGMPARQWQGNVASVDLVNEVLVLEPRNGPLMVQGQSVSSIEVRLDANTYLERRAAQGGGRFAISLSEVQPGLDRAWVRGVVVGPAAIDAAWIRVREQ
ncbi:MAG: hypothetical protein ACE37K_20915 [Planctomycetota bacterium]